MRTCLPNVSTILAVTGMALSSSNANAQVASGDLVVLTAGTGQTVWTLPAAGGAPTAITGMDPAVLDAATSIEVEPTSGDLILAVPGALGTELWRATLSGLFSTAMTKLVDLPGTSGMSSVDTHLEIDGTTEPTGCLLVLSARTSNPFGAQPSALIHRVSIAAGAAVAVPVPWSYPGGATPPEILTAITSDPAGAIYLSYKQPSQPFPHQAGVYSLPAAGGVLSTVYSLLPISPHAVGVDLTGIVVAAGLGNLAVPPSAPNYWCGTGGLLVATSASPFTPPSTDIHLDAGGAAYTVAVNGFVSGAAGLGHLRRIPTGSCSAAAVSVVADFADAIVKVGQAALGKRYGCACVASNGVSALLSEVAPIVAGTTWTTRITGAVPGSVAILRVGLSNSLWSGLPLPLDLAFAGASGCVALTNGGLVELSAVVGPAGTADFSLPIPIGVPTGVTTYSQAFYIDFATPNPLKIATSNGVESDT